MDNRWGGAKRAQKSFSSSVVLEAIVGFSSSFQTLSLSSTELSGTL